MSMLLALWNRDGQPVDESVVRAMLVANPNPESDGQDFWLHAEVALAHQHFWITPEEINERQPCLDPQNGCVLTCTARLDNRLELLHTLGLEEGQASSISDAELILKAYQRWGTECPAFLLGDFAFVLWDRAQRQMFAARDALGCQDLHYLISRRHCLLATRLISLLAHPSVQPKLNETSVAKYLAMRWEDDVNTFYNSIFYLPPAHCLLVTAESSRLWRYWDVDPDKSIHYACPEQYGEHFRELIKATLRVRLRSTAPLGISLSGGLDSTSLACLASETLAETGALPGRLGSYSYVFDAYPDCDERAFIQPVLEQAAQRYPIRPTMLRADSFWPRPFADDWLILQDYPGQDPYYYLVRAILKAAQADGVRVMLSGFYGDDLYTGSEHWFADLILAGRLWPAARTLTRFRQFVDLKEDLLEQGLRAMIPARIKKGYRRLRPRPPAGWTEWIHPELAKRSGLAKLGIPELTHPKFRLPGQQKHYSALFFGGYPISFAGYQIFARNNGMEFVFPYADRRIVEFMLALPAEQIGLPGLSRRVLREALRGKLPETVRRRQGKTDFSALFDKGLYEDGFPAISNLLLHSQVLERGFVRRDWLTGELERKTWTQEGLILWMVLCVETWLQKYW